MEPILQNDFRAQWSLQRERALAAVDRVGASGRWILGAEVREFEARMADTWGLPFCVGCASGLDAIEIGLRCAGLEAGAPVLTTPLSAFATSLAIVRAGGVPVFCDVDASGQLDLAQAAEVLASRSDIRHLVPVHLFGHAIDRGALAALRERFSLVIVEDCAQAVGARSDGEPVGGVGTFAATSFYPTKNLGAMGDAGALLTADASAAERARSLRDYGQSAKYRHDALGMNSRLDEVQAAILRSAVLPGLGCATARRREIAARYLRGIRHPGLSAPPPPPRSDSVWHLYPVLVDGDRDAFREHLKDAGIQSGVHYPHLIPEQKALQGDVARVLTPLPRARRFADGEVSLPIHPFLSDGQVDRVIEACNAWPGD